MWRDDSLTYIFAWVSEEMDKYIEWTALTPGIINEGEDDPNLVVP